MTNNYRVLVVEDDSEAREAISEELMELKPRGRMECDLSTGVRDATKKVKAKYYDLVLVDLELGANQRGALDLYTHLTENHAACELILMTSINLDSGMGELVRLFGDRSRPRFVGFIDKREDLTRQIQEEIGSRYAEFTQNSVDFVNLELPVTLLERRKHRYNRPNTFPLRSDNAEVGVEIDRLLRKLYVQLPVGRRLSGVRVSLDRVGRHGLSAAVVLNATVYVNSEGDVEIPGHKTVLKIGPLPDIIEESSRYAEFVRFGMEQHHRVELLATATADTLGGLVYSFAGSLHRQDLTSMDEVLSREFLSADTKLSGPVIRDVFARKQWWSIEAAGKRVGEYFKENYRTDLTRSASTGAEYLRELPQTLSKRVKVEQLGHGADGAGQVLYIPGAPPLTVPGARTLGAGPLLRKWSCCLVHGDLHGGNVMIESKPGEPPDFTETVQRVCVIDYRNSGFGPRCVDAAALESSIRLADSDAACRVINEAGESKLNARQRTAIAKDMALRREGELQVYRFAFDHTGKRPEETWAIMASEVLSGIQDCFPGLTMTEYLATAIPYVIRNLGYDLLPVARIRMCAWLSALHELLPVGPRSSGQGRSRGGR